MRTSVNPKLMAELKKTLGVFIYLALFLGAFATYRALLLAEYRITMLHGGWAIIEALVMAKVIAFGSILRLGERFNDRPLIVPTLYKTFWFALLILAFSVLEHLVTGWFHGESTSEIIAEILGLGLWEILARTIVKLLALLPLFAVWEIGRVIGEGKLFAMFFTRGANACDDSIPEIAPEH